MFKIVETGLTTLDSKLSKILDDTIIDDSEFQQILSEYKKIKDLLYQTNIDLYKKDIQKDIAKKLNDDIYGKVKS
jgi:predicted component of type VI protein secretion system